MYTGLKERFAYKTTGVSSGRKRTKRDGWVEVTAGQRREREGQAETQNSIAGLANKVRKEDRGICGYVEESGGEASLFLLFSSKMLDAIDEFIR